QLRPLLHLHTRRKQSLDGPWRYILDPYDAGRRGNNQRRTFWRNFVPPATGPLVEYDWASSPEMTIPTDWNSHAAELFWYDDTIYFRRDISGAAQPGHRRVLAFEGANYHSQLWLDDAGIGQHEGGFTPFAIDLTDRLADGAAHGLTVAVDSRHHAEAVPTDYTDWHNYGGITRSVWLVDLPPTWIADWFVRLDGARVRFDIELAGAAIADQSVTITLGGLRLSGRTGADGRLSLSARRPAALGLWSPEAPRLHDLRIDAAGDSVTERIGLRSITTRGRELLFNGRPLYLRGISLHEEPIGPVGTRRMSEADARRLLTEAKALGCNFVRLAHYPHSEATLRVADELGLIVWAEIPVYWEHIRYDSVHTLALARSMQTDMIRRDRNRCSIGLWSVANETPITDERNAFLRTLIADARALDPTRLITAALNKNVDVGGAVDGTSVFTVTDPLGADLDVLAANQYEAWYSSRTPDQIRQVSFTTPYDKPLMFSEFGADALAGHHGPREELWTEEFQAWLFEETLKMVDRTVGCVGLSPWLLKDFRSPRRWHARYQQFWNRKGLISETGQRKLAFDALRRFYEQKAQG
ncbi:MAG: glycoside hydrolase family 2 protein, partial [Sphingomonas sp.]